MAFEAIHKRAGDRQRAWLICPLERRGGQTFHVAAAHRRHLVTSIHGYASQAVGMPLQRAVPTRDC